MKLASLWLVRLERLNRQQRSVENRQKRQNINAYTIFEQIPMWNCHDWNCNGHINIVSFVCPLCWMGTQKKKKADRMIASYNVITFVWIWRMFHVWTLRPRNESENWNSASFDSLFLLLFFANSIWRSDLLDWSCSYYFLNKIFIRIFCKDKIKLA